MSKLRRRVAAYGLVRDASGRVLLVPADGPGNGAWELPGGTVAHGESPQAAIARLVSARAGPLRAVTADQVQRPDGVVVHHDRLVFEVAVPRRIAVDAGRWFAPADLVRLRLPAYAGAALGVGGEPAPAADRDEGWPVDRGLAVDASGPRLRVQRFSTYAHATDPAGRVLLARIAAGYPGAGRWHLPGGGTDFGEQPAAALLREVTEETAQHGRVVGLLGVSHRHNPAALGWEGYPIDWHTIRVVYEVAVDEPTEPYVTEAAGGSTADAAWMRPGRIEPDSLTELAAAVLRAGISRGA